MGLIYLLSIAREHAIAIRKRESVAVLPILTLIVVVPIWALGAVNIDHYSEVVGRYLQLQENAPASYVVQISASLAILVFLSGFTRSMYTITLLDQGRWWELPGFDKAISKSPLWLYWTEIVLRSFTGLSFILHQISINRLGALFTEVSLIDIQNHSSSATLDSKGLFVLFSDEDLDLLSPAAQAVFFEDVWFVAGVSSFLVFSLLFIWTIVAGRMVDIYLENEKPTLGEEKLKEIKIKKDGQFKTQITVFVLGLFITLWILVFSQLYSENSILRHLSPDSKLQLLSVMSILGAATSVMIMVRVFLPQAFGIVARDIGVLWERIIAPTQRAQTGNGSHD